MKRVIISSQNWADEFDYLILSVMSEELWRTLLLNIDVFDLVEDSLEEVYFGTNEALYFKKHDIKNMVQSAKTLTPEQEEFLDQNQGFYYASLDIIDRILDFLEDVDDPRAQMILDSA